MNNDKGTIKIWIAVLICIFVATLAGVIGYVVGSKIESAACTIKKGINQTSEALDDLSKIGELNDAIDAFQNVLDGEYSQEEINEAIDSLKDKLKESIDDEEYSDDLNDALDDFSNAIKDALNDEETTSKINDAINSFREEYLG